MEMTDQEYQAIKALTELDEQEVRQGFEYELIKLATDDEYRARLWGVNEDERTESLIYFMYHRGYVTGLSEGLERATVKQTQAQQQADAEAGSMDAE